MSQTFTMVTRFSATLTVAWDGQGHAWRLNGSPDGRNAAEHTFNCEACDKGMGYYGARCPACGAEMPPVWIRSPRLDHPINVQIKDELRKAAFKAFDEARDEMIEGTHTETYAVVGYPGDVVDSLTKAKEVFRELYKGAIKLDHPPMLFKPELFEMTPDVPPEYRLPDLGIIEYTEEERATLLAEVQRRARERAYQPPNTPEEVEMLAKGAKWLEEYDRNGGSITG